ncbi:hypothetical protein NQ176_g10109 [Zarea fungicola]|uniref:Uncharacterized protein n=1 Tax=Zarea fungicola TaxID=93591 RepID=A0ACC1MIS6_9HYPO|nr:hypothetical protein NQ176_g10109 [Lecanicillium fungicola]
MPSDEYAVYSSAGGGALKLKGSKIDKKKKKKKGVKSDLEKNLSTGDSEASGGASSKEVSKRKERDNDQEEGGDRDGNESFDDAAPAQKTESERRHEETLKKRLLKMAEKSGSRPELLKTHKERVEELNTYLSRLSEHHDMPKIGPG